MPKQTLVRSVFFFAVIAVSGLAGAPSGPSPEPRTLTVAAAADLKFAMDEIVREFTKARPEVEVRVSYGSSGNFFSQIANGAPFDVFFSADMGYVDTLREQGLTVPGSEFVYAIGRIVLIAAPGSEIDASRGLVVLRDKAVKKVAIANPRHAPYGRAAEAALRKARLYDDVQGKLVLGENVAQAAQFVESGAADAGIVALSLARRPGAASGSVYEIPLDQYPRLEQGGAILKATKDEAAARAFRDFVLGAAGRALLSRYGFQAPDAR